MARCLKLPVHPCNGARFQWQVPSAVGSIGPHAGGGLVVALRTGIHFFDTATGELAPVHQPERHLPRMHGVDTRLALHAGAEAG